MIKQLKPMLPSLTQTIPQGERWVYELKYDGFRTIIYFSEQELHILSRNQKSLNHIFPEVTTALLSYKEKLRSLLPVVIDGEIGILDSKYKANFERIQQRGRVKQQQVIAEASKKHPACLLAFDLLASQGEVLTSTHRYLERKQRLASLFQKLQFPTEVEVESRRTLQFVPYETNKDRIWRTVTTHNGEGIIAKQTDSFWHSGVRTKQWLKIKNYKFGVFILSGYDKSNGYFHVSIIKNGTFTPIGVFSHGLSQEENYALTEIIKKNKSQESKQRIEVEPSICVELQFLEIYKQQLREPRFVQFRFDQQWEDCTWENLQKHIQN
ncbi:non-homologous end-joining DNA ligase [Desertibacillus haloalkaliphilus]|uniref:non-homologous end-joining DNA ligase n=1 Tax=Desertibacillus haloalkaliphilus TaxID=1328930 RepID=UPI0028AC0FD4|nr:non-homologous end-joining DNA ligase [Desertibacillus haloalkaliphilus]